MARRGGWWWLLVAGGALLGFSLAHAQAGGSAPLLNVSGGQIPNDTGSDGETKMTIEESADLGGDALKVVFAPGDSFGDRSAKVKNWKGYARLRFVAFNPGKADVELVLNLNHKRTSNYQTRMVHAFSLQPGKNEVVIGLDELKNVNGSAPDLSSVGKWWINCAEGETPTLYFGDLLLEGGDATPARPTGPPAKVAGDPERVKRIRAAKMPKIERPIMFDTPEADAVLSALEVFPPDNPWNLVVADWPLHPQSRELVASVGNDKFMRTNEDMCFVIVPPNQPKVDVKIVGYPDESDPGPFPVPDNLPIEGYPKALGPDEKPLSLAAIQRRPPEYDGDRHGIVLDPINGKLYEFFVMGKTGDGWAAEQSSVFDLRSNKLRPDGWTSADAAGLPIFPAVVRYDELARGQIDHPLRVTIRRSRRDYVYPATHHAGHTEDENVPRMGERFRLRSDFDISGFSPEGQTILKALKKYGMFVADNGIEWAVSIAPDRRIPSLHAEFRKVKGRDFEAIVPPPGYRPAK